MNTFFTHLSNVFEHLNTKLMIHRQYQACWCLGNAKAKASVDMILTYFSENILWRHWGVWKIVLLYIRYCSYISCAVLKELMNITSQGSCLEASNCLHVKWPCMHDLTHCGLVKPYGIMDLSQHCIRWWLILWQLNTITPANINLSGFFGIHNFLGNTQAFNSWNKFKNHV